MNKLDELEKLADAAWEKGRATEVHLGYTGDKAGTYVVQMQNKTLKQLIALCRLQNLVILTSPVPIFSPDKAKRKEALAAYEQMNGEG